MTYYPTIEEDLARAKIIIAQGHIYGGDTYAAYKLLESFVAYIEERRAKVENLDTVTQPGAMIQALNEALKRETYQKQALLKVVEGGNLREQQLEEEVSKLLDAVQHWREQPELYEVAKQVCHEHGLPWTDPRTNVTHYPPAGNPNLVEDDDDGLAQGGEPEKEV